MSIWFVLIGGLILFLWHAHEQKEDVRRREEIHREEREAVPVHARHDKDLLSEIAMQTLYRPHDQKTFLKLLDNFLHPKYGGSENIKYLGYGYRFLEKSTPHWEICGGDDIELFMQVPRKEFKELVTEQNLFLTAPYWNWDWYTPLSIANEPWHSLSEIYLEDEIHCAEEKLYLLACKHNLYYSRPRKAEEIHLFVNNQIHFMQGSFVEGRAIEESCAKKYNLTVNAKYGVRIIKDEKYLSVLKQEIKKLEKNLK